MKKLVYLLAFIFCFSLVSAQDNYEQLNGKFDDVSFGTTVILPLNVTAPQTVPTLPVVIKGTTRNATGTVVFTIAGEANKGILVKTDGSVMTDNDVTLNGTWGTVPTNLGTTGSVTHTFTISNINANATVVTGTRTFKLEVYAEYTGI